MEESVMLFEEISSQLKKHNHPEEAEIFSQKAEEARNRAETVRRVVLEHETLDQGPLLQSSSKV